MKAPVRVGSPLGKPPASVKAAGILEVILGGGVNLEDAGALVLLAAALEAEDWSDLDEVAAADAEAEVASEAEDAALGLDAVGIALLVDPVSCGRFPCAVVVDRRKPAINRKSIINENADECRKDRIMTVAHAA